MAVPELIGRYRVGRRLGSGAFATVWFADDDELSSPVAVKVLAENWTHQLDVRARFTEEGRIMRRAESDRLVRVLDVGELPDGRPYLVMTYASGGTLAERLEDGPLPVGEALRVAVEAARGVTVLHELGIVHRDLKPSNVFFHENRVLVGDLGLAKALTHGSGFTVVAGSPGYMAPEQALLGSGLDERTDVYALGALTYHMLTGRTPTLPASIQAVPAAAAQPVTRPSKLRPGLPPAVDAVVMRALAAAPARRWPTAAAFADALDAARTAPEPRRRPAHGRRLAVTAALSTLLLAAVASFDDAPTWTRVSDTTGQVSVWVPAVWAEQVRGTGWNPATLSLPGGHAPGLVVGTDLSAWEDPANPVPGVFAGLSPALRGTAPALPDHSTCVRRPDPHPDLGNRTAVVQRWTGCGGTGISFTEALITPATGDYGLYVQIRQVGDTDHTEAILREVRTS
ncbi:serine/threonine-protein kinase [Actinoplanes sp. HUAS TT8]|uniref:serine/threonine-protein kinase n=1 Tax=Actinoplanes sp. HUAS TT8 TaxID=3447453 RepID=UPI003F5260B2